MHSRSRATTRKGITNDCIALPAPAYRLHFTVIYAQLCQIICISFVAPTTVSIEMTWHFFRIPNEASEREWRGMCLQARQGGSRQHVQTCGGHAQSIITSALPTLYQVDPMYKCIIELPSLAMNK